MDFLPLWAFMCVFPGLTFVPDAGPHVPEDDPDEVAPDSAAYPAPEKANKTEMARTVAVFCVTRIADVLLWSSSRSNVMVIKPI